MTAGVICTPPILQFFLNDGQLAVNGSILTQVGGLNAPTYADSGLTTPLPNPIPLNSRGEISDASGASRQLFLTPNTIYVFTLFDGPNGTGNQIWQAVYVNGIQITAAQIEALSSGASILASLDRTAAEVAAGVTPVSFAYATNDVRRLGVVGDGVTDDTAALQRCYTVGGDWFLFPGAKVRCTNTITGVRATRLYSNSPISPIPAGVPPTQTDLIHDFSGTFFNLVGDPSNDQIGSGFTFERICFMQINGTHSTNSGICIRAVHTPGVSNRVPWIRMTDCHIETISTSVNDWQYCIYIDGTGATSTPPNNMRDCFFNRMRIVAGTFTTAAIYISGCANMFLAQVEANLANADIIITGTDANHLSSSANMIGCSWNNIILDWCQALYGAGNSAATVTSTVNTLDVLLGCSCTGSNPTLAGARVTVYGKHANGKFTISSTNNVLFDIGTNPLEVIGPIVQGTNPATGGALRLPSGSIVNMRNNANSGNIGVIGTDASDHVVLSSTGQPVLLGFSGGLLFGGNGSPQGVVTANPGSIYLRNDGGAGTTLYVKESGVGTNTGWVGK